MAALIHGVRRQFQAEQEALKTRQGYWLVRESDGERFFISERVSVPALERMADRVLSDAKGWGYWVDYCLGLDINRNPAWSNLDHTDRFI